MNTFFFCLVFCLVTKWSKSRLELKGICQEVALELVEWFSTGWWLMKGLSCLRCLSVMFAQVKSVSSAKLFPLQLCIRARRLPDVA